MIVKLKKKFMLIIMSIMTIVILVTFISINLIMNQTSERQGIKMMKDIAENDGINPVLNHKEKPEALKLQPPEKFAPINNFSVRLDDNYQIIEVVSEFKIGYEDKQIISLTNTALSTGKEYGNVGSNIKFLIKPRPYGSIIVFSDNKVENDMKHRLAIITSTIGAVLMAAIYLISKYLSDWAIKPVEIAFQKQKQFVADASHELKTPITIIDANIDVLLSQDNIDTENLKWFGYIKNETKRMNSLVQDMLYLAKLDNNNFEKLEFNLSEAVENIVLPFESLVYEQNKNIYMDIEEDVSYKGDSNSIKQVLAIFMDNSVKYCDNKGSIYVRLKKYDSKIKIEVENTGSKIANMEKIFERFYREDSSRDRNTGGFGLGLSIAKAIVENHNGKIYAENTKDGVKFCIEF